MSTKHVTPAGANIFADNNIPDAENEKLRLSLLTTIREWVSDSGLTQTEAAAVTGVKQPTLNNAVKGRYHKLTMIDWLGCYPAWRSRLISPSQTKLRKFHIPWHD